MIDKSALEKIFKKFDCIDFKWVEPKQIVVAQWVRMKCVFGCANYGKSLSCPPYTPSISECRDFFLEYTHSVLFHFPKKVKKPENRIPWSKKVTKILLNLEREVFLSGYHKSFVLPMNECRLCKECAKSKEACRHPKTLRPIPESMGVDLFTTARKAGYQINVLRDYTEKMNRFALLMID